MATQQQQQKQQSFLISKRRIILHQKIGKGQAHAGGVSNIVSITSNQPCSKRLASPCHLLLKETRVRKGQNQSIESKSNKTPSHNE
jgi:hypothetical protein